MLFYVLVLISVFARKNEWMKGACLAAALLLPAVAAVHALILTADSNLRAHTPFFHFACHILSAHLVLLTFLSCCG